MKDICFVGFDTSNYTTSAAVCNEAGEIVANIKAPLPVKEGECGLRQSEAVFAHIKNLPCVTEALREAIRPYRVEAVGCSATPRSVEGSYMPCFLSGVAAAEAFSAREELPLYRFSHQDGHIMAALYSSGAGEKLLSGDPFCAFHVSGGTTEVLLVHPKDNCFCVEQVGGTNDLNAGQAIDRVGVMMGLSFPCGREMEQLALSHKERLPSPHISVREAWCNLSGLQNLCERLWRESRDAACVSAYVFAFLGKTLSAMSAHLRDRYPGIPLVYAGGVMSNSILQKQLGERENAYFASPAFSADNAAGIALLARRAHLQKP